MQSLFKRIGVVGLTFVLAAVMLSACQKVQSGYAGIKEDKGEVAYTVEIDRHGSTTAK